MKDKYYKTVWIDNKTKIDASKLNNIEEGLENLFENALTVSEIYGRDGIKVDIVRGKELVIHTKEGYYMSAEEVKNAILEAQLPEKDADLTGLALATHDHEIKDILGLQELLDNAGISQEHLEEIINSKGFATKDYVNIAIESLKSDSGQSEYATKTELSGKADRGDSYLKLESDEKYQLKGDYLTSIPEEYVTEDQLETKADKGDSYTKEESDEKYQPKGDVDLSGKADLEHTHTVSEITDLNINELGYIKDVKLDNKSIVVNGVANLNSDYETYVMDLEPDCYYWVGDVNDCSSIYVEYKLTYSGRVISGYIFPSSGEYSTTEKNLAHFLFHDNYGTIVAHPLVTAKITIKCNKNSFYFRNSKKTGVSRSSILQYDWAYNSYTSSVTRVMFNDETYVNTLYRTSGYSYGFYPYLFIIYPGVTNARLKVIDFEDYSDRYFSSDTVPPILAEVAFLGDNLDQINVIFESNNEEYTVSLSRSNKSNLALITYYGPDKYIVTWGNVNPSCFLERVPSVAVTGSYNDLEDKPEIVTKEYIDQKLSVSGGNNYTEFSYVSNGSVSTSWAKIFEFDSETTRLIHVDLEFDGQHYLGYISFGINNITTTEEELVNYFSCDAAGNLYVLNIPDIECKVTFKVFGGWSSFFPNGESYSNGYTLYTLRAVPSTRYTYKIYVSQDSSTVNCSYSSYDKDLIIIGGDVKDSLEVNYSHLEDLTLVRVINTTNNYVNLTYHDRYGKLHDLSSGISPNSETLLRFFKKGNGEEFFIGSKDIYKSEEAEYFNRVTPEYVDQKIAEASLGSGEGGSNIVLSDYLTKAEAEGTYIKDVSDKADAIHTHAIEDIIDLDINELGRVKDILVDGESVINEEGIASISFDELATETYVDQKITEAQIGGEGNVDLSDYVTREEATGTYLTESSISNKADRSELFSKDYNDLTNKPVIPSIVGLATENYVQTEIAKAQLDGSDVDLSGYATKIDLLAKAEKSHKHTKSEITDLDLSVYAKTEDISKTYQTKGSYLTSVPSEYITESILEAKGYLTEHQDLSEKADLEHEHTISDITDLNIDEIGKVKDVKVNNTTVLDNKGVANITIPAAPDLTPYVTKTDLNSRGYLTAVPSGYVTEEDLAEKKYLTTHQDISGKADKTELFSKDYNELLNKPTIPSITGLILETKADEKYQVKGNYSETGHKHTTADIEGFPAGDVATESFVQKEIAKAKLDGSGVNLDPFLTKDEATNLYQTKGTYLTEHQSLAGKADLEHSHKVSEITDLDLTSFGKVKDVKVDNVSVLTESTGVANIYLTAYAKSADIASTYQLKGDYLTKHQDISGKADKLHEHTISDITDFNLNDICKVKEVKVNNKNVVDNSGVANIVIPSTPDLTPYAKTADIAKAYQTKGEYLTSIPTEYITETKLTAKGYLTSKDIESKADKSELFSGAYSDLTGLPDIPSIEGLITEEKADEKYQAIGNYLTSIPDTYITETKLTAKGYLTSKDIEEKANKSELFSGSYTDLKNKPTIPSIDGLITEIEAESRYLKAVPSEYVTETVLEKKGYLTSKDIENKANKSDLFSKSYNDLTDTPNIPSVTGLISETSARELFQLKDSYVTEEALLEKKYITLEAIKDKADRTEIPSIVGLITKKEADETYLTAIPDTYVTNDVLTSKKYLTSEDIIGKANVGDSYTKDESDGKYLTIDDFHELTEAEIKEICK